jgi:hypothetical protein
VLGSTHEFSIPVDETSDRRVEIFNNEAEGHDVEECLKARSNAVNDV